MDSVIFKKYFLGAEIIEIPSQMYDVDVYNTSITVEVSSYFDIVINTVMQIFQNEEKGGILVFLTG